MFKSSSTPEFLKLVSCGLSLCLPGDCFASKTPIFTTAIAWLLSLSMVAVAKVQVFPGMVSRHFGMTEHLGTSLMAPQRVFVTTSSNLGFTCLYSFRPKSFGVP